MKISRATPVLFVDRVEPTRDFFTKVGFTVLFDVPESPGEGRGEGESPSPLGGGRGGGRADSPGGGGGGGGGVRLGFAGLEKDGVQVMVETRGNANEGQALREI